MNIIQLNKTLYGRIFTQGKTYFETIHPYYIYSEKFKLNYELDGTFAWFPCTKHIMYNSIITIKNDDDFYTEKIEIYNKNINSYRFYKNRILVKKFIIPNDLLNNIKNYETIEYNVSNSFIHK